MLFPVLILKCYGASKCGRIPSEPSTSNADGSQYNKSLSFHRPVYTRSCLVITLLPKTLFGMRLWLCLLGCVMLSETSYILCYPSQLCGFELLKHLQVSPLLAGSALQWLWNNTRPLAIQWPCNILFILVCSTVLFWLFIVYLPLL